MPNSASTGGNLGGAAHALPVASLLCDKTRRTRHFAQRSDWSHDGCDDCRSRLPTPYLPTFAPLIASRYKGAAEASRDVGVRRGVRRTNALKIRSFSY